MALDQRRATALEERGFDLELLERLGVSNSAHGTSWVQIPYVFRGRRINTKHRTVIGPKRFAQEPNAVKCMWNADVITDTSLDHLPLVITEGELDAIACLQSDIARTASVPDGAPPKAQGERDDGLKYEFLEAHLKDLRQVKEIVLAVDDDMPGINLLNDLAIRLGRHRCKFVRYPEGCKDPADVLRKHGPEEVRRLISDARWMKVGGIYRMSDLPPLAEPEALSVGMEHLDDYFKIRRGDFIVVTGIPGHGKTTFVNELVCRLAEKYGWTTAVASFEQTPQTDFRRNLRTFHMHCPPHYVHDDEKLAAADRWIDRHFVFLCPDEDEDATLRWVLERGAAAVVQEGADVLVVDPWNELDHDRPRDMSLTEYTGFAIKQFRRFGRKYQVPVIVVAHPTKLDRTKDDRLPVPTLYDISDSAHWANKCDAGIVIYRDGEETVILVRKVRYEAIGKTGKLCATFLKDHGRFEIKNPKMIEEREEAQREAEAAKKKRQPRLPHLGGEREDGDEANG